MRSAMLLAGLLMLAGCASTTERATPSPGNYFLTVDPADMRVAVASTVVATTFDVFWKASERASGEPVSSGEVSLERLAVGREVGFSLPPAREEQLWTIWTVPDTDRAPLREFQALARDARRRKDNELAFKAGFHWSGDGDMRDHDVVYMTLAVHAPEDGWMTVMDNMAVVAEKTGDETD